MFEILGDLSFAIVMSSGGAVAGWALHRALRGDPAALTEEQRMAKEVLSRLKDLASHMASNVGQHSSRVEKINQELSVGSTQEPEGVISAVARLIEANQSMQSQIKSVEEKLHEQAQLVEMKAAEARTDVLTGLPNRRAFDDKVAACFDEFQCSRRPFSLILGDIDHFKKFNDTYGHQTGDEVLRGTARVLRQTARESDLIARYGGEEIAIVLPGTTAHEAIRALERVRQAVESACFRSPTSELKVTMSFGIAELLPGEDVPALIRCVDTALYAAKQTGRNRGCWHDGREIRPIARPCDVKPVVAVQPPAPAPAPAPESQFGLSSKSDFGLSLGRRLAEWRRRGPAPALLMMQIDDFPSLVERYGREIADLVLRSAVQFLGASVRAMDFGSQYGEATFGMLLPGASTRELIRVAERLRQAVARCILPIEGQSVQFTVSLAGAVAIQSDSTETMLVRVEAALEEATAAGGNCTFFHNGRQVESAPAALERIRAAAIV
ncbi:MAG: diguanylate cyclase [Thermoguttaceae bacterium]